MEPESKVMAVALNNRGARLFVKGDLTAATTCFRAALNTYTKSLSAPDSGFFLMNKRRGRQKSETAGSPSSSPSSVSDQLSSTTEIAATKSESSDEEKGSDRDEGMMTEQQQQSSFLPSSEQQQSQPSQLLFRSATDQIDIANLPSIYVSVNVVTLRVPQKGEKDRLAVSSNTMSALTFNLALCYHILSSTRPAAQTHSHRQNAIRLYKMAHKLRQRALASARKTEARRGTLEQQSLDELTCSNMLDLSIFNNTGLVLVQTGDTIGARRYFEQLALALTRFSAAPAGDSSAKNRSNLIAAGFVKNLIWLLPESIIAPAA